ncbi:hypothetical protein BT96DRAFT_922250 [Gymnopus androsaceus JB14]|uniref:DUF6533 domain-containing protein n=1 Tax=Gymnopus androsaceus JB14 TaxID=1447944 RepID=A0A6A4HEL8_9AGAR|nr:hypothetical protein BT96DRAFT_922250 [Gymnopus androsaceus JB14]
MTLFNNVEPQVQGSWYHFLQLAACVIVVYDYLLTIDLEVERFWKANRGRLPAILFYLNRYITLLGILPVMLFTVWPDPVLNYNRCKALQTYLWVFVSLVLTNIGLLFILRLYAIYGGSKRIAIFLGFVTTCAAANNAYHGYYTIMEQIAIDIDVQLSVIEKVGCIQGDTVQQGLHMVYTWVGVVVFDICVFILTLWKTMKLRNKYFSGIASVIMRDGAMYFGVIALLNTVNILTFALGSYFTKSMFSTLSTVIASVMSSHLMLNLRDPEPSNIHCTTV